MVLDLMFHDANTSARFEVWIDNVFFAVFTECVMPSLSIEAIPIKEGGQNLFTHKLPGKAEVGTLKLKMGLSRTSELLTWYMQSMNGEIADARRNLMLLFYDQLGIPVSIYFFLGAYPIKYAGPSFRAGESAAAIEEIELAFHEFMPGSLMSLF